MAVVKARNEPQPPDDFAGPPARSALHSLSADRALSQPPNRRSGVHLRFLPTGAFGPKSVRGASSRPMAGWKTAACLLLYAYTVLHAGAAAAYSVGCASPVAEDGIVRSRLHSTCKVGSAGHLKEVLERVTAGQALSIGASAGSSFGRNKIRARVASPHLRMRMKADSTRDDLRRAGIHDDEGGKGGYDEGSTNFIAECCMPTDRGMYRLRSYRYQGAKNVWRNGERVLEWVEMEPVVMYSGDLRGKSGVVVRVHDQCFTSEVMGSKRCDCKEQLDMALTYIMAHGGAIIYMPQEGRGIGLANKIAAYELQDGGLDTVDANRHLGFDDDERSYDCVPDILAEMEISSVELVTNNPFKVRQLTDLGVTIDRTRPSFVAPNKFNSQYLRTKAARMAHSLELGAAHDATDTGLQRPPDAAKRFGAESARAAATALARGRPIAMLDNDIAYLVLGAEQATAPTLAFAARHTTGVLSVALPAARGSQVVLAAARRKRVHSVLLTASERAKALRDLVDPSVAPADLVLASDVVAVSVEEGAGDALAGALQLSRLGQSVEGAPEGPESGVAGVDVGVGAAIAPLLASDGGGGMDVEELSRFATQHALVVTSSCDIASLLVDS